MTGRYLEDFAAGQRFSSGQVRIDTERIKNFAAEFDPQPFHLDEGLGSHSIFGGLAASGWHTAATTMKLLVDSDFKPAWGIVAAGFDELHWPRLQILPRAGNSQGEEHYAESAQRSRAGVCGESVRPLPPCIVNKTPRLNSGVTHD